MFVFFNLDECCVHIEVYYGAKNEAYDHQSEVYGTYTVRLFIFPKKSTPYSLKRHPTFIKFGKVEVHKVINNQKLLNEIGIFDPLPLLSSKDFSVPYYYLSPYAY